MRKLLLLDLLLQCVWILLALHSIKMLFVISVMNSRLLQMPFEKNMLTCRATEAGVASVLKEWLRHVRDHDIVHGLSARSQRMRYPLLKIAVEARGYEARRLILQRIACSGTPF
jgi:hypothetical protein